MREERPSQYSQSQEDEEKWNSLSWVSYQLSGNVTAQQNSQVSELEVKGVTLERGSGLFLRE